MTQVGYVYIVRGQGTSWIKVGKTTNILKRLQHLQQGVPFPLCLLSAELVEDMHLAEQQLKERYRPYSTRGEWYALPEDMLALFPNDATIPPLSKMPVRPLVDTTEQFTSRTPLHIRALLEQYSPMPVASIFEAMEARDKKDRWRIRVCLSRLCAADIIARDGRGVYRIKNAENAESVVTASSKGESHF